MNTDVATVRRTPIGEGPTCCALCRIILVDAPIRIFDPVLGRLCGQCARMERR